MTLLTALDRTWRSCIPQEAAFARMCGEKDERRRHERGASCARNRTLTQIPLPIINTSTASSPTMTAPGRRPSCAKPSRS